MRLGLIYSDVLLVPQRTPLSSFFSRDYLFEEDMNKSIREVMTPKERLVTAEYGLSLEEAKAKEEMKGFFG